MCNIHKKTSLKRVVVYKIVIKQVNDYYAFFSGYRITTGSVKSNFYKEPAIPTNSESHIGRFALYSPEDHGLYNPLMIGRTSGFKMKKALSRFYFEERPRHKGHLKVLRMTLAGTIYKGDATLISRVIENHEIVYAGSKIVDFKEVKMR